MQNLVSNRVTRAFQIVVRGGVTPPPSDPVRVGGGGGGEESEILLGEEGEDVFTR